MSRLTPAQAATRWLAHENLDRSPQRERFAAWLEESEENRQAWIQAHQVWDVFDDADDSDLIAALARAARRAGPEPVARPLQPWLIAASIAALTVSAALFAGQRWRWLEHRAAPVEVARGEAPSLATFGRADYATGEGQKSIIDLPDGTRLTLDASTAVDVAFARDRRDIRLLNGHAFFDVAHDREHPFAVEAAGRVITALGTQFDVKLQAEGLRVVLAEGSVSVGMATGRPGAPPVKLKPGEAFSAPKNGGGKVTRTDLNEALAWKQGVVEFRDQPLSEAVRLLNRYTRAQIVIRDPKVAALRITGVFRTGDIKRFGRSVSEVLPVRMIARDADTYELVSTRR
ncbi:FecR domain-containing protein [Caulobacter segnis]|uniref:FecR family protein n=1 Tax=Caulobacter segnis TaxID=88688 RepID=UPI002862AAF0|nr:FecR domain-containing protein [Caulobacter segnis]MDR6624827.1 transmembrane sensor [Caulobacter segnis]